MTLEQLHATNIALNICCAVCLIRFIGASLCYGVGICMYGLQKKSEKWPTPDEYNWRNFRAKYIKRMICKYFLLSLLAIASKYVFITYIFK